MKTILAILCALVVLFAGGCALMLVFSAFTGTSGALLLALIPASIVALNVAVLMGLYGKGTPQPVAFYILAGLDVVAAGLAMLFWSSISFQVSDIWTIAAPVVAVLLAKAALTVLFAWKLPQG